MVELHRRLLLLLVLLLTGASAVCRFATACDCGWMGPFLKVTPQSPYVIYGTVLNYFGKAPNGAPQAMDFRVEEVWRGEIREKVVRIWGDNGMLCRPTVDQFPVGSKWVLALDGPGSKPGMTPDRSISNCGQFWLRVEGVEVVGNIDNATEQKAIQRMSLNQLKQKLGESRR